MRRFWRVLKFTGLGVLTIVSIGLIWFGTANWRASARLEASLAELRNANVPMSLAALKRAPPLPDNNAATYLRRAASQLEAIESAVSPAIDALSEAEQRRYLDTGHTTDSLQQTMQRAFAEHVEAVPLLFQAAAAPDYDPQINYDQDQQVFLDEYGSASQEVRQPIRVLDYYVMMLLNEGKQAAALDTCVAMFKLCRHFDSRPLLIGYLVNLAVRQVTTHATDLALRAGPLPRDAHAKLETELGKHDLDAILQRAIETERAYGIQAFDKLPDNGSEYLSTPMGKNDLADYIELLDGTEQQIGAPYAIGVEWVRGQRLGPMAQGMIPAVQASLEAGTRTRAQLNCLRMLNTLVERFPTEPVKGPAIADLGLPAAVWEDPYTGKQLRFRFEPGGWLVYSVGANQRDDGGKVKSFVDGGFEDVGLQPIAPAS
jgi:hypothetical protein